jgi:predicted RNA-binding Zn-ribbon protein involved in translation (DUF1610 family)
LLTCLALSAGPARAQAADAPSAGLVELMPGATDRLEALSPVEPAGYLRLGEEILALARTEEDRLLARRLFTLAYELARTAGDARGVQASACIALADTSRFERERRWLWSIARLIDPRYSEPDWSRTVERVVSDEAAYRAATTLGLLRAGEGIRARELLRDESVRDVFVWYSGLLTGTGPGDVLSILDEQAERWPCPECRNERIVRTTEGGEVGTTRCFTCRGNPGWQLNEPGLLATLRFESRVLSGVQRSWGAQLAADLGEPLRDPDPAAVAPAIGVDPARSVYRDGRWVDAGGADE